MPKICVTGGAGFIGSHVVDALVLEGNDVFVIDNFSCGYKKNIHPKARFYQIDITDSKGVQKILQQEKPEYIFHFAAQIDVRKSVDDPIQDARINILGSLQIIENARIFGAKKFIFSSTGGAIYGDTENIPTKEDEPENPLSPYGITKLAIEKYLSYYHKVQNLLYIALRFSNVYGPRQNALGEAGVVAKFSHMILCGKTPVIFGDGKNTRDFVYIDDIARACILAMKSDKIGCYNVGTGIETDINTLGQYIGNALDYKGSFIHGDFRLGEVKRSALDFSKIKKDLGWMPKVGIQEGIKITTEWFRKNGSLQK